MARKIINRKQLRDEVAAADKAEVGADKEAKKKDKPATKRKSRKEPAEVRMKLFWGVYNQSLKRVALYEYSQKKQAEQKAADLSANGKAPHFVQKVKEPVVEE
jgi:hypothetical protein